VEIIPGMTKAVDWRALYALMLMKACISSCAYKRFAVRKVLEQKNEVTFFSQVLFGQKIGHNELNSLNSNEFLHKTLLTVSITFPVRKKFHLFGGERSRTRPKKHTVIRRPRQDARFASRY
jgi:hypothetical protein